jgi:hypothetical protein
MEAGTTITVKCATAAVGSVSYPSDTTWSVTVTGLSVGDNFINVSATDSALNAANASVDIVYAAQSVFDYAVFGSKSVTMSAGSYTDSYPGTATTVTKGEYLGGDVGTNSTQSCSIQLSGGGTEIFGETRIGTGGNTSSAICASGGSLVYNNDKATLTALKDMTPKTDPGGGTSMGTLTVSGVARTIPSGEYRYSSINVSGGGTLTLSGQVTLHIDGNLTLSGGSKLVVSGGPVVIYANGQKIDFSGGSVINEAYDPNMLVIYGTSGLTTANLSGGGTQYFLIYAPNAAITLSGGQSTYGSVIGNTVTLSGGSSVHFEKGP